MVATTRSQPLLLGAALIAAVVGGGAAFLVVALQSPGQTGAASGPDRGPAVSRNADIVPSSDGSMAEVHVELEQLRRENVELAQRVADLEDEIELGVSRVAVAPIEDATVATRLAESGLLNSADPEFVASVGDALAQIREEEERQAQLRWQELQAEKIETRLGKLGPKLGLSSYQVSELRTALLDRELRRAEINELGDEMGDRDATRASLRALREETNTQLATILTPEQLKTYRKSEGQRDEKRFGGSDKSDSKKSDKKKDRGERKRD